jgi:hypothetical protein
MADSEDQERTQQGNPFTQALNRMLKDKAARPQDVYRLAIIVQGMLESLNDPEALETIRFELRALINDISQSSHGGD